MHRILVIGTGSIGERHVRCMQNSGRAVVGICEVNEILRQTVAEQYGITDSYANLDEALQATWDAAFIATPAQHHIGIAQQLAEAGIHLFIEKPLALEEAGIAQLMATVQTKALHAAVAYVYRSHPAVAAMREAILSGKFGKPVQVMVQAGQHFPTFRPAYREIYYTRHESGGGAIQDSLTHLFNAAEWLVGPIDRIAADAEHKVLKGVAVEDTVNVMTRHGDVMGVYMFNQHQTPNEVHITVVCERGTARLILEEHRWQWMSQPNGPWHNEPSAIVERDDWFNLQANIFLDVLEGKAEPRCTLAEGLHTLRVNRAALASANAQQSWQIISKEHANHVCTGTI